MSKVWNKIESLAKHFEEQFNRTGEPLEDGIGSDYEWHNQLWTSPAYRRAHLEIVDHRESHKLYIVHCTIFPHLNDPSPIWGFDAVCGPNKITGAFHDFSNGGDPTHPMMRWFAEERKRDGWHKPRELPPWAKAIFSPSMIAAGNIHEGDELDDLCKIALQNLDYYLENVGFAQQDVASFEMAQNRYCHYQKQNPHVIRSMVSMGIDETKMRRFVNEVLFPEIA